MDPVESTLSSEGSYESPAAEGLTGSNAPSSTEVEAPSLENETGPKEESEPAIKELTPVVEEESNSAGRTTGQKEKDAEAKELFGRMKTAYANEFGKAEYNNVGRKPQAKFWRARQGLGEEDKNGFINKVVEEERNTLLGKMSGTSSASSASASGDPMATLLKALETATRAAKELGKTRRKNSPKMVPEGNYANTNMGSNTNGNAYANTNMGSNTNAYAKASNSNSNLAEDPSNVGASNSFMRTPRASSYGNSGNNWKKSGTNNFSNIGNVGNSNYGTVGRTRSRRSGRSNTTRRSGSKKSRRFESPELAF